MGSARVAMQVILDRGDARDFAPASAKLLLGDAQHRYQLMNSRLMTLMLDMTVANVGGNETCETRATLVSTCTESPGAISRREGRMWLRASLPEGSQSG